MVGNILQLQGGHEHGQLRVGGLNLAADAAEKRGLLLAVQRGGLMRLQRHQTTEKKIGTGNFSEHLLPKNKKKNAFLPVFGILASWICFRIRRFACGSRR
jgi:hypothetical protein